MDEGEVDEVKKQEFHVSPEPEALESKQDETMELAKPTDREVEMDEFKDECGENSQVSKSESPSSAKEETQTDENSQEEAHPEKIPKEEPDDSQEKSQESVVEKNQEDVVDEEKPKVEETEQTEANDKIEPDQLKLLANGAVPKSEKPVVAAINKRIRQQKSRSKRKTFVAMYQSEISENKIGIKLCIKKSETSQQTAKRSRKRSRKSRQKDVTDSDDSEYEKRGRKEKSNNNTDKLRKVTEPKEQSVWGNALPEPVLLKVFNYVVQQEGCMPTLFRLGRVCTLWRRVSLVSCLWRSMDLSLCIKERYRTELKLKWLIENRLKKECTELNVSNWKISDVQCVLNLLVNACPGLVGITLAGWKHFTSDHLMFLAEEFTKLERIDLSSINLESHVSKSAVGFQSLCKALQIFNGRLTHLHLAHNRLAGIPQIVTTLSKHCPNLALLDLSNVRTVSMSHSILHIEKLQEGCRKLKILRITNSHVVLSTVTLQEQMDSPGFPELEELSVASLSGDSRLFDDECLQRILKKSTKLNLLDVRGCVRLTHDSLIRLPCWDLKYLFLSGCSITRDVGSGLELIASKWAHSLTEFDLAWANVQKPLDSALRTLAEKGVDSPLVHLNLCGSSVSEDAVKEVLASCPLLNSINLSSCRGLPRGVKRLMQGPNEIKELRDVLKVTLKVPS